MPYKYGKHDEHETTRRRATDNDFLITLGDSSVIKKQYGDSRSIERQYCDSRSIKAIEERTEITKKIMQITLEIF